ncbi:hypothetical protein ACFV3E_44445 [Streptomyces sp. NPDC059718]
MTTDLHPANDHHHRPRPLPQSRNRDDRGLRAAGTITLLVTGTALLSFAASLLWTRLRLTRWLG